MKTIRFASVAVFMLIFTLVASAQKANEYVVTDTSVAKAPAKPVVDSMLVGIDILENIQSENGTGMVVIHQSSAIKNAINSHISANKERKIQGYRVRIYFDNSKNARNQSDYIAHSFAAAHPEHKVYRSHVSPYFKVTVGDFRTKTEAQIFAQSISGQYPSVFLVKESINFPD